MAALENVQVTAYRYKTFTGGGQWVVAGTAVTAADGTYTISGLPAGNYKLRFLHPDGTYITEYWTGHSSLSEATEFTLADSQVMTGKDAGMASAASISGTVTG